MKRSENLEMREILCDHEIQTLSQLAEEIWREYFQRLLSKEQIDYMLEKFQSFPAICQAIREDGYRYFFLMLEGEKIGYTGVRIQEGKLFLSKFYLKKEYRGQGLGRRAMGEIEKLAKQAGCTAIWLTCNRENTPSLAVYDKLGFSIVDKADTDIGAGFQMNDFILEKAIS